ncbi:MAG: Holliday junction branch migration DNA helicase RuvB [Spirochaetales bacterium]|nr:Holliday junction branch migration DNA helicase RuvB [Spirochaetales bacterium]
MDDTRISSGTYLGDEDIEEVTLRPKVLEDFVGQKKLRENLLVYIQAARQRHECLDHVFFSGPPGLGKTTLSAIIANEMGVQFRATSAPALEKAGDIAAILTTIGENNVFFIDEIHRLKPLVEEILYSAMEDFQIDVVVGNGPGARSIKIPLPPFTLIGATTKAGLVSAPLQSRFGITNRLDFYNLSEIAEIIHRSARILGIAIEDKAAMKLSQCSRGTPRIANRLLRRMRDFAQVWGDGAITTAILARGLDALEIDEAGLDNLDRRILSIIIERYKGGPVGSETLAISIGEAVDTLEDVYEPYLIQTGFIKRTPRGRVVTELAYKHLGKVIIKDENQGLLF